MHSRLSPLLVVAFAGSLLAVDNPAAPTAPATPAPPKPAATPDASLPKPTLANVPYGDHERQVLDFYKADSDKPTPLLFFIHGGGWVSGDKRNPGYLKQCLAAGISVVSINYRYSWQAQLAGVKPPVKAPLEDAARALQFVRSKSREWNIDKQRIGASGGSAGACSSIWLAMHNDMADPKSSDPIARESTRLWCAAVNGAQTSLDPKQLKEWTPNSRYGGHAFGFMDPNDLKTRDTRFAEFLEHREEVLPWIKEYSPIEHASADDPPIYLYYTTPPALGQEQKDPTHTANYGVKLQEKLKSLGVECELVYPGAPDVKHKSIDEFLIDKLKGPAPKSASSKPAAHPTDGVEVLEDVVFATVGGKPLHVDIMRPKQTPDKPMAAVLIIHGGGWSGGTYKGHPLWLAAHGYFTASVEYRLSGDAPWPAQIEDCKLAVRWLRANAEKYRIDPARIGVMGHSAGGHLVSCLGTLGGETSLDIGDFAGVSSRVQAVVDEAGPVDFTPEGRPTIGTVMEDHPGLLKLFGGSYEKKTDAWKQASSALHVAKDAPPFLILHGEQDHLVPIAQAEHMADALKKAGVPYEFIRIKNAGHGLRAEKPTDTPAEPDSIAQQDIILHFFDQQLKR